MDRRVFTRSSFVAASLAAMIRRHRAARAMRWLGFAPLLGMAPLSGLTPLLGLAPLLGSAALAPADDPQASSATRPASRPESSAIPVPIRRVLMERNGVSVVNGGFGSSMARDPRDKDQFYFPTDRGPNVDGVGGAKVFVVPNYTPTIGKYRLEGARSVRSASSSSRGPMARIARGCRDPKDRREPKKRRSTPTASRFPTIRMGSIRRSSRRWPTARFG